MLTKRSAVLCLLTLAACGNDTADGPASLIPADYATSFVEVRDCRRSGDHDFEYIRILVDSNAAGPFMTRQGSIPEGSVVIKEQYDPSDQTCAGEISQWTLMKRLPIGSASTALDYHWQRVLADGRVDEEDKGCINCHTACGVPPDGFDGTCALP